jgi:hypothetical protein
MIVRVEFVSVGMLEEDEEEEEKAIDLSVGSRMALIP